MYDILDSFFTKYVNKTNVNQELKLHAEELWEELMKKFNEEETALLIRYADAHNEFNNRCSVENFKQGFWIGCRFMQEMTEF
ncbi:MAG: hypothetical protein FWE74_05990 [Oscillospiraceae bacterium]|nr:hypothetical protein [Oscillospiraceae bacterium]